MRSPAGSRSTSRQNNSIDAKRRHRAREAIASMCGGLSCPVFSVATDSWQGRESCCRVASRMGSCVSMNVLDKLMSIVYKLIILVISGQKEAHDLKITRHSDHLYQLTRFAAVFPINCYLVREDDGFTLVDTGISGMAPMILDAAHSL